MTAPYSPAEGVELILFGSVGAFFIGDRKWPVRSAKTIFTEHGFDRGWMAEIAFENGAIVLVVANDDVPDVGRLPFDYPRHFAVSLHHQFGHCARDWYQPAWRGQLDDLPLAAVSHGRLINAPSVLDWQLHEDPDPEWLVEWLDRITGLASEFRRSA